MRILAKGIVIIFLATNLHLAGAAELGDAKQGGRLIARLGCGGCHAIEGVVGAVGNVGPPLSHIGTRVYLGGVLENTPKNMVSWLRDPQKFLPRGVMPDLGLSESDARDIAAYLDQLK